MNHPWNTRFFRSLSRCSRWGMGFAMTFHLYPPLFYAVFLKVATCSKIMRQHITKSMGTGNVVRIFPSELLNDILEATKQNDIPDHLWHVYIYLRAAAPAADPGRIGKEAKQIGIKTLRCFAPWGFRPFSYVYCCEIYLIGLNFHL